MTKKLENRARDFAKQWHGSQTEKHGGELCWHHSRNVAQLIKTVAHTPEMVAAAWIHELLDDTGQAEAQMRHTFGDEIAELVVQLTDISKPTDGSREWRRAIDLEHLARATPSAKTIKLAHFIVNSNSIIARDPHFAVVYLRERRWLLDTALREGDVRLWRIADQICRLRAGG